MRGLLFFCAVTLVLVSGCNMRYGSLTQRNRYQPVAAGKVKVENHQLREDVVSPAVTPEKAPDTKLQVSEVVQTSQIAGSNHRGKNGVRSENANPDRYFSPAVALQDSVDKKLEPNRNARRSLRFSIAGLILGALLAAGVLIYVSSAAFVSGVTSAISTGFFLVFFGGVNGVVVIALLAVSWGIKALLEMKKESEDSAGLVNPARGKAIWGVVLGILLLAIVILIGVIA